jgi:hypothetical protein
MAMVQLAVLNAITAAVPGAGSLTPDEMASRDVAVIAAAHGVLSVLHPDAREGLDSLMAAELAGYNEEAVARGIGSGRSAASAILAERENDGWNAVVQHPPREVPGAWAPTPPAFADAIAAHWGDVTPFALEAPEQFRPGPPSGIETNAYLADLRNVFEVGEATSAARTQELTDAARFWVVAAAQGWNGAARQVGEASERTSLEYATVLAMLNIAIADALIACFDAKYFYDSWRPVTAIQAGALGSNPEWQPLIPTPPFPSYPSAHACAAGAAVAVLARIFGINGYNITLTSPTAPGITFTYSSFEAIADQIDDARIFGGIHTREDQLVGRLLGMRVGQYVYEALVAHH